MSISRDQWRLVGRTGWSYAVVSQKNLELMAF